MKKILILNTKGGCGKTTISVTIASFFANWGIHVALADFDRQHSSIDWVHSRSKELPNIKGISAWLGNYNVPDETEYLIMDTPAGIDETAMNKLIGQANIILIPILPSPLDIRAAGRLIHDIMQQYSNLPLQPRIGVIANRVRQNTRIYESLKRFLAKLNIDFVASLRDTQNYVVTTGNGISLFELPNWKKQKDIAGWCQLINWINNNKILDSPKIEPSKDDNKLTQIQP